MSSTDEEYVEPLTTQVQPGPSYEIVKEQISIPTASYEFVKADASAGQTPLEPSVDYEKKSLN